MWGRMYLLGYAGIRMETKVGSHKITGGYRQVQAETHYNFHYNFFVVETILSVLPVCYRPTTRMRAWREEFCRRGRAAEAFNYSGHSVPAQVEHEKFGIFRSRSQPAPNVPCDEIILALPRERPCADRKLCLPHAPT